ncbi:hypothetical protein K3722_07580 [Leisingera caerulea]|uniref:Uncharacterized protein n=1 Tax=Leisingera caerulea TaxID=506591 RepID=A0ABY5X090_LEICA|nr:hypothetical protein [Leisingera caerulea]UWQ59982.1 hypothetical protein K3722_07580 [Leisingera caerulea]
MSEEPRLQNLSEAIRALTWAEMVRFSEAVVSEVPHLQKSESLDRDGMARTLVDIAMDIDKEFQQPK